LSQIVGASNVVAVDSDPSRHDRAAALAPGVRLRRSLDEALDDPEVFAVVVATPLATHAALAEQAMAGGRHVLVEKPLAQSPQEAEHLTELAESNGLTLMTGHTFLFSPRVERIRDMVQSGGMGNVHYVTSARLNLGMHRSDANVIWDLAAHDFSIVFHILGEFPIAAHTVAHGIISPDLPEVAFIDLTFRSGVIASVQVAWLAPRKVRNTVIVGERNMVVYDDTNGEEPVKVYDRGVILPDGEIGFGEHQLTYRYGDTTALYVPPAEPLALEVEHFLEGARTGRPRRSDGRFGTEVVKVLAAADRSRLCGGEVPVVSTPLQAVS
jgi:predicted dehydrogenase